MPTKPIPNLDDLTLTRKQVQAALRSKKPLREADMRGIDLSGLSFDGLDLTGCKFAETNLTSCSFIGSNLSNASLWRANLSNANLTRAVLVDVDMDLCTLDGCCLGGARIHRSILPLQQYSYKDIESAVNSGRPIYPSRRSQSSAY